MQEGNGYYAKSAASDRQQAYQAYLQRTGQHLPLFYFSITSRAAMPDSVLQRIPEAEQRDVQQLAWRTGNWQSAYRFWQSINQLQHTLTPAQLKKTGPSVQVLLSGGAISQKHVALQALAQQFPTKPEINCLQQAFKGLQKQQFTYSYLLPSFHWHGKDNQYHHWITKLFTGDFGNSYRDSRPVTEVLLEACFNTLWITLISMLLTTLAALLLSIKLLQSKYNTWRRILMSLLFLTDSIPLFVLALCLLVLFASPEFLQLFPVYGLGYGRVGQSWLEQLQQVLPYLLLPILCLSLAHLPYLVSQFLRALTEAKAMDFTRTAKAKGLSEEKIIWRHVLRNALLPIITLLSDFLPALIAGTVVIEAIFAIPGMGRLLVSAVQARDYPVIVAIVLIVALAKVLSHLLADLFYALSDPRIRSQTS